MKSALTIVVVLIGALSSAQKPAKVPQVGESAPPLALNKVLDKGKAPSFGDGKWHVVDFWATWCGSCVAEFPEANKVIQEMKGQPIDFIAITDEEEKKVATFLTKRPLSAQIGLDKDGSTFKSYGIAVIPTSFVIDPQGKVAAATTLKHLTKEVLTQMMKGAKVDLPAANFQGADLEWDTKDGFDAETSLAHVIIQRSTAGSGGTMFPPDSGRITGDGVVFGNMIQDAYGARFYEVINTHPEYNNQEKKYRFSVKAPDGKPETAREMLREELKRLFSFSAEWVEVTERVPVLKKIDAASPKGLKPSKDEKPSGFGRHGMLKFGKMAWITIVEMLGGYGYGKGIVDETGNSGFFDLDIQWTPGDKDSFEAALKQCGLQCTMEDRKVRRLKLAPG